MDFTLTTYSSLIGSLQKQGFLFQTFNEFLTLKERQAIILRHDVDRLSENSLVFARFQSERGIRGTYYFRVVTQSWDERIIREISSMGHEIGYHYEDLSLVAKGEKIKVKRQNINAQGTGQRAESKNPGDHSKLEIQYPKQLFDDAIDSFARNLDRLRKLADVRTICMHGSPMSRWDSRLLWKYYDYRDFGIIGEPYFDIDFDDVLYLTDTGRRWDGEAVSVRDKTQSTLNREQSESKDPYKDWKVKPFRYRTESMDPASRNLELGTLNLEPGVFNRFHRTTDIIRAVKEGNLPDWTMITCHPQRWSDDPVPWIQELIWQNMKNVGKYFLVKTRSNTFTM